jgi:aspartate aminotransferase-like enzyme
MDLLLEETYDQVYLRHKKMANLTQQWAKNHFALFSEPGYESITVTCIRNTLGKNVEKLIHKLAQKGVLISNGYGKLKEKTFRIGHMGEWSPKAIEEVLGFIEKIWCLEKCD